MCGGVCSAGRALQSSDPRRRLPHAHAPPLNKRLLTFAAAVSTVLAVSAVTIAVTAGASSAANACSAGDVGLT